MTKKRVGFETLIQEAEEVNGKGNIIVLKDNRCYGFRDRILQKVVLGGLTRMGMTNLGIISKKAKRYSLKPTKSDLKESGCKSFIRI